MNILFKTCFYLQYFCTKQDPMNYLEWNKFLFLLLIPFILLGQSSKKDLSRLTYDELHDLYFANEKNQKVQRQCANAYLAKANAENIAIRKAKANYQFALLYYYTNPIKAIMYLDSVIKYSLNTNDKYFPAAAYCEKADFLKKQFKFKINKIYKFIIIYKVIMEILKYHHNKIVQ